MLASSELIALVKSYDPEANADMLKKSYIFAMEAHGLQKRASGAPYFYHPAEVARILAELHMDVPTVVTGLLHDVLEDTNVSFEELEEIFGSEIAFLVEGVTKLSKINYTSAHARHAENFQKFILAVARDIRVLLVKLVDRLHNMRTLNYIEDPEKRRRISLETLNVYAPLAERIGLSIVRKEIEDIAFYNLHPNEYSIIAMKLEKIRNEDSDFIENTIAELNNILTKEGINATVSGREKEVYSIWKKMQKNNISVEQVNDITAFRIIVNSVKECYAVLGLIHTHFQIMPGRFKDYISIPKLNNYRSLHTTVLGPKKQPIEVQIRTKEMHKVAEEGVAAHWGYKSGNVLTSDKDIRAKKFVQDLVTVAQTSPNPEEAMNYSRLDMYDDEVFCFTPSGEVVTLPRGATVIDFAYWIHTDVGNTCIGVRVNGKMVPLKTVLRNGDQVDIISSPYQHPEVAWERFVVTGKAKSCIRKYIRSKEKAEFVALGLQLTQHVFAHSNVIFQEDAIDLRKFSCDKINQFYYNVGKGVISLGKIRELLPKVTGDKSSEFAVCITDFTPGIAVHFADCCHPILDDHVIGILVPEKGLVIHLASCAHICCDGQEHIQVKWNHDDYISRALVCHLRIVMLNKVGSFADVTEAISQSSGHITNLRVESRSDDFFELQVDVKVRSDEHLKDMLATLRSSQSVKNVKQL